MTPENFCYWLQGLLEIGDPSELNMTQVEIIKEHLNLVFKKETKTPAKIKLSDYLLSPNEFDEKFKVKPTHNPLGDFACATPAQIREQFSNTCSSLKPQNVIVPSDMGNVITC